MHVVYLLVITLACACTCFYWLVLRLLDPASVVVVLVLHVVGTMVSILVVSVICPAFKH